MMSRTSPGWRGRHRGDGYARNYLVPRRLAERWTGAQKARIRSLSALVPGDRKRRRRREVRDTIEEIAFVEIFKLTPTDALYGAVTGGIAKALKEAHDIGIDRRKVVIEQPIKYVGNYTVIASLHPEVSARLKVASAPTNKLAGIRTQSCWESGERIVETAPSSIFISRTGLFTAHLQAFGPTGCLSGFPDYRNRRLSVRFSGPSDAPATCPMPGLSEPSATRAVVRTI